MFFQPAALVIDCNGSAVMHQTIDDRGCSVCEWALNRSRVKRHGIAFAAWVVTAACGLPPAAAGGVIIFAALPTAQSCYVMTAAMHGNAPAVAAAASLQTLAAIVTLPIWISLAIL